MADGFPTNAVAGRRRQLDQLWLGGWQFFGSKTLDEAYVPFFGPYRRKP